MAAQDDNLIHADDGAAVGEIPEVPAAPYSPDELLEQPREALAELLETRLESTSPQLLAQFLERLDVDERRTVLRKVSIERAAEILAEMEGESAAEVLEEMREKRAVKILEDFEPDDAADIVAELDEEDRRRLLGQVDEGTAQTVTKLLAYDPETAAGAMNPEVETLAQNLTVEEAIAAIRAWPDDTEDMHCIYVLDGEKTLVGSISIKRLIRAKPAEKLGEIMEKDVSEAVQASADREQAALKMAECNLAELPVVDKGNRFLGIITHDDVIDIMREEATEDLQVMSGAGGNEGIHDNPFFSVGKRLPWLQFNLVTASIAAGVVLCFQNQIGRLPLLAGLMPVVAGIGGSCGQQTLAVAIRSLALDQVHDADTAGILAKQLFIGIVNGIGVGLVAALLVTLYTHDARVGGVLLLAMMANMATGSLTGAAIPLLMRRIHRDPAQCSSIMLTAITDTGGFFIFLTLGSIFLLR
jgi:magnesium transporter